MVACRHYRRGCNYAGTLFEGQGHASGAFGTEPEKLHAANGFFYGRISAKFRGVRFFALSFAAKEFAHMKVVEFRRAARVGAFGKHKATTSPGELACYLF
jgi:hypothetical protein